MFYINEKDRKRKPNLLLLLVSSVKSKDWGVCVQLIDTALVGARRLDSLFFLCLTDEILIVIRCLLE